MAAQATVQATLRPRVAWRGLMLHALRLALLIAMLALLMLGWRALHDPWTFPIRVVKVGGELDHLTQAAVQEAIGERLAGQSFFTVDLDGLLEGLDRLAWVRQARVRREWPDTLHLWIEEHTPLALWRGEEVLTADGTLIHPQALEGLAGLPALSGADGRERALWEAYAALGPELAARGLVPRALREDQRGSLTLLLEGGTAIRMGRMDAKARMRRFLDVFDETLAGRIETVEEVDLRYAHGFSVRWKTPSSG